MDVMMDVILFVWRIDDRSVCVTVLIGCLEDPPEGCNFESLFSLTIWRSDWTVLSVSLQGSDEIFFWRTFAIERPILTLELLFDDKQYLTQWSNVTVNYALVRCS